MQTKTSRSFLSNPSESHPFVTSWFAFGFRLISILRKFWWQASKLTVTQTLLPSSQYFLLLSNSTRLWITSNDGNKALKCNNRFTYIIGPPLPRPRPMSLLFQFLSSCFLKSLSNKQRNKHEQQSWKWFNSRWNPIVQRKQRPFSNCCRHKHSNGQLCNVLSVEI